MLPQKLDLAVYRGDTFRAQFRLYNDTQQTLPADLTDVVAKAELRDKAMGSKVLATFDCVITLPNIIDISLPAATAGTLTKGGAWDLQLTYPGGDIRTVIAGKVAVTLDVTDSVLAAPLVLRAVS